MDGFLLGLILGFPFPIFRPTPEISGLFNKFSTDRGLQPAVVAIQTFAFPVLACPESCCPVGGRELRVLLQLLLVA